jgi:PiT family inorganic phosphate transporter
MILLFLTSGLFLGWSLGANNAGDVFGTAVATRMVRFRTAAIICSVFVILGSVISGAGTTATLGNLGAVNALGGSFMVALAAGLAVAWMTKAGLPVSVSQAIVGAILGWNFFTGSRTDLGSLTRIVSSWVACPLLAACFAAVFYLAFKKILARTKMHILELDALTRTLLLVVGAFASYSWGANNIANVVGVFVPAFHARSFHAFGPFDFTYAQVIFLVGGMAIASGVFTYSQRVMATVGSGVFKLGPITGLVVVLAESIVLILFASQTLESWLIKYGIPPIPLVPVSSTQAAIGAVVGVALAKGGRGMRYSVLGRIAGGWVATPAIAALVAFLGLFFLQNVFGITVRRPTPYEISGVVAERLARDGIDDARLSEMRGVRFANARDFGRALAGADLEPAEADRVFELAEVDHISIDPAKMKEINLTILTPRQIDALKGLERVSFDRKWQLREALVDRSGEWEFLPDTRANHLYNKRLAETLQYIYDTFRVTGEDDSP